MFFTVEFNPTTTPTHSSNGYTTIAEAVAHCQETLENILKIFDIKRGADRNVIFQNKTTGEIISSGFEGEHGDKFVVRAEPDYNPVFSATLPEAISIEDGHVVLAGEEGVVVVAAE